MRLFELLSPPTSPRPTKSAIRRMSVCSDSSSGSTAFFRSDEDGAKPRDIPKARPQDKEHMLASLSHWSPSTPNFGEFNKARFQSMFRSMGFKSRASLIPETPLSPSDRFLDSSLESWVTAPSPLLPCALEFSGSCYSTLMPPYPLMSPWEDFREISVESLVENLGENSVADPLESSISSEFDNDKAVLQWAVRVPVSHSYIREILLSNGETFYKTLD